MTVYARDRFGAPIEIIDYEAPVVIAKTYDDKPIHEDESYLEHLAYVSKRDSLILEPHYLFEEDVYSYVQTLHRKDLIEIINQLEPTEIIELAQMEEIQPYGSN